MSNYTSTPAHLLPSPVTLPGVGYLEFNPRTGVYERRISPVAPVGDWAEGLDTLPPTAAEHRARAPRTPARPARRPGLEWAAGSVMISLLALALGLANLLAF